MFSIYVKFQVKTFGYKWEPPLFRQLEWLPFSQYHGLEEVDGLGVSSDVSHQRSH